MKVTLPKALARYDQKNEQDTRAAIEKAFLAALEMYIDIDLGTGAVSLILRSPDGTRWRLGIGNDGALITVSL